MKCSVVTNPKNAKRGTWRHFSRICWRVISPIIATSSAAIAKRQNAISTGVNGFDQRTKIGLVEKKKTATQTYSSPAFDCLTP